MLHLLYFSAGYFATVWSGTLFEQKNKVENELQIAIEKIKDVSTESAGNKLKVFFQIRR